MSMHTLKTISITAILILWGINTAFADVTVFAAASLTNALTDIGKAFEAAHNIPVKLSFASSSALAKQVEQGAPADVFASADTKWMDYLDNKGKINHDSRTNLLGNTLVVIAPQGKGFPVTMKKGFNFARAFKGKLCTGVVESVPVGIYAKEALTRLGWWQSIQRRVVGTEDVRAALNLVERGECDAGIVYETDAKQSKKVEVIGRFPADTHAPIVYPFALVTQSGDAKKFLDYLKQEPAAEVFARYGFKLLEQ
ncbi:molybdate ABC transporter substrate-binding protein [Methylocaldum szegediense]|uniref:Molybdate ABC transporter periplasmic binding protein n=1 Tax=Methylocaldum szegediense TaxID=73780 RepID=A0ABM9I279_9GAMM|nr:molybdate ABC transporter substrate-binding protein [Methylocaldum szegediense]CAI8842761.1 molybdate ABC transporter periplasmic binding protein [Methylocaldum szegediense]